MFLLRYSATFICWKRCELKDIDMKTRNLFTIYGRLHPKFDVYRLYMPRNDGGGRLIALKDCVELAVRGLEVYVYGNEEILTQAARRDRVDGLKVASVLKKAKKEKRLQDWEERALYSQYSRQTKEVRNEQNWVWFQNGDLKRKTEILIVAAQDQSIRIN